MNPKLFKKRLQAFYSCWNNYKHELWGNSDVIVISTLPSDSPASQGHRPISSYFYFWLLGRDYPETTTVFTANTIHFLCAKHKAASLQPLAHPAAKAVAAEVFVHGRKKGEDGLALMDDLIRGSRVNHRFNDDSGEIQPLVIGHISGECPNSKLLRSCCNNVKSTEYSSAGVKKGLVKLFKFSSNGRESADEFDQTPNTPKAQKRNKGKKKISEETEKGSDNNNNNNNNKTLMENWEVGGGDSLMFLGGAASDYFVVASDETDEEWVVVEAEEERGKHEGSSITLDEFQAWCLKNLQDRYII